MRFTPALFAIFSYTAPAAGQSRAAEAIVSRDSAVIVFPADTFPQTGGADPAGRERNYALTLRTDVPDLFVSVGWSLQLQGDPFPQLIDVLDRGKTWVCRAKSLESDCRDARIQVRRIGDQAVMHIRDTALINDLFRLRPTIAEWGIQRPVADGHTRESSVGGRMTVRYLEPGPPPVDARYRARAARQRADVSRALDAMHWIGRVIHSRWGEHARELWIAVGDSTPLDVQQGECHVDVCSSTTFLLTGRWRVMDTTIAKVTAGRPEYPPDAMLVATRVGRTSLVVDQITGRRGRTFKGKTEGRLAVSLIVTPGVSRIEIDSLPTDIRRFDKVTVRFRVITADGKVLPGALVTAQIGPVTEPRSGAFHEAKDSVTFSAQETLTGERQRILLTYGRLRDSVTFRVGPRRP
jgi:hypothetical protein